MSEHAQQHISVTISEAAESRVRPFLSRLKKYFSIPHFEFWNTHVFHFPIYLYWLFLSCKARSLFFFSASNPGIETGGMMGESKYKILQKIDSDFLPKTVFYPEVPPVMWILADLEEFGISFPFVVKPDIGQGGWMIEKINNREALEKFLGRINMPFMIQEFIQEEQEFGVLYYKMPGSSKGVISSLALKELLTVTGDGSSSIAELVMRHPRGGSKMVSRLGDQTDLKVVPAAGTSVRVSFKGNHSYGTAFRNLNSFIDDKLTDVFDKLCARIDGFYFGRFDLCSPSIEDLKNGRFRILELNGSGSEPLHVFDPETTLTEAYRSAIEHWKIIYSISRINNKSGNRYITLSEARRIYRQVSELQRQHNLRFTIGNA